MSTMLWHLVVGLMVGSVVGWLGASLCIAGKISDLEEELLERDRARLRLVK